MHPLKHPRNAILVGLMFVFVGFVYWLFPYLGLGELDWAGPEAVRVVQGLMKEKP